MCLRLVVYFFLLLCSETNNKKKKNRKLSQVQVHILEYYLSVNEIWPFYVCALLIQYVQCATPTADSRRIFSEMVKERKCMEGPGAGVAHSHRHTHTRARTQPDRDKQKVCWISHRKDLLQILHQFIHLSD